MAGFEQGVSMVSTAEQPTNATANTAIAGPAPRHRVVVGRTGLSTRQHRRVLHFRATVEDLVAEAHGGEITALQAMRIESAARCYAESVRAQSRLAEAAAGKRVLSEPEAMGWSDRVTRHLATRDRILDALGLDRDKSADIWDSIYRARPVVQTSAGPANGNGMAKSPSATHGTNGTQETQGDTSQ